MPSANKIREQSEQDPSQVSGTGQEAWIDNF